MLQARRMDCLELLRVPDFLGQGRVEWFTFHLPFLLRREFHLTLISSGTPPTPGKSFKQLSLLLELGLVECACSPDWLESQHPRVFHLSLVSSPSNHQNPVYCGLVILGQISISWLPCSWAPIPSNHSAPLSSACRLGLVKSFGPALDLSSATLPFPVLSSLLPQV